MKTVNSVVVLPKPATNKKLWQLEALRGAAAFYVVLHHIWQNFDTDLAHSHLKLLFRHGLGAVIVFFVLSGFVIEYSTHNKTVPPFREYFRRRFLRIYPLFSLSLLITYVVASLRIGQFAALKPLTLFGNLFMLQGYNPISSGRWFEAYYNNGPLWSLTYEWWFYMMYFPIRMYVPERFQTKLILALSAAGYLSTYYLVPNQASFVFLFFIIWWTGVDLAKAYLRKQPITMRTIGINLAAIAVLTALLGGRVFLAHGLSHDMHMLTLMQFTSFYYGLGILLIAFAWKAIRFKGFNLVFAPFARIAPISYALYVLHRPVVIDAVPLLGHVPLWISISVLLVVAFLLSYVFEARLFSGLHKRFKPAGIPSERLTTQTCTIVSSSALVAEREA